MKTVAVDTKTIKGLVYELQRSLVIVRNDYFIIPGIDDEDLQQWYELTTKMLVLIYQLSTDVQLKAIINCAFENRSIDDTVKQLRAWNNDKSFEKVIYVSNVIEEPPAEKVFVVKKNIARD
jgi:hypothetical protein